MKGFALWIVIVALAALGGGLWMAKPAFFPGESRRAANSARTTEALIATTDKQGAVVAASLTKIAEANAETPPTPQKAFIGEESGLALTLLPHADPNALIAAERRKAAVLEGRVEEARRLYEAAAKNAARLQQERDEAIVAKRESDGALAEAAAAHHARTLQALGIGLVALVALGAFAYAKFYGIGPATLGQIAHDIKAGADPITAMDIALPPRLHRHIARARKLAAP